MIKPTFTVLLFLITTHLALCRTIREEEEKEVGSTLMISDGMHQNSRIIGFEVKVTNVTCESTYGFLPCTTKVWGQLFLILVYEYLLSLSEMYISRGSNLFFEMFGTGYFGASAFHVLGIFPQVIVVLVSGVSGTTDTAVSIASMGMGLLAGSTIMSLTIIWGSVVAFGSYNLSQTSSNVVNERPFSLTGYGVTTDSETKSTARIMLLSMIPFLLLQFAKILNSSSSIRVVVLISLIVSCIFLATYIFYQMFQPWIQSRRFEYLMRKYVQKNLLQFLSTPDGKPDESMILELFQIIDKNHNRQISAAELRALILGIQIEGLGLNADDFASRVMEEFDISNDSNISESEFIQGVSKWLVQPNLSTKILTQKKKKLSSGSAQGITTEEQKSLVDNTKERKDAEKPAWWNYTKSLFLILLGTAIAVLLAMPLMETLQEFATAINVSSFLISYFVVPLALNFRQGYGAIVSAREKTEKAVSLTLSEIYGGVFMNNVMGLVIFLGIVYFRKLTWDVSAEILTVLIICSLTGLSASFSSKFPFWTSIIAYAFYPISLAFIYVLTTVFGWG